MSPGSVAGLLITIAASAHGQTTAVHSDRGVFLRIELDRATYRVGQRISVRLTLQNTTGHTMHYVHGEAAAFAVLVIFDATGRQVKQTLQPAGHISSGPLQTLMPQEEFRVPRDGEWASLTSWGYELQSPGKYSIVGIPVIGDPNIKPDNKAPSPKEGVLITIEP